MPVTDKFKGFFLAFLSAFSFGLIPLFIIPIKKAGISMDVTLFYRFFLSAVIIGLYLVTRRNHSLKLGLLDALKLLIMGVLYALSAEFLFIGYDLLSAGVASTVLYTYPMLVALILYFVYKEKITLITGLSIFFATIGVMMMGWEGSKMEFNLYGVLVVLLSALSYAIYMVMVSKGHVHLDTMSMSFYSILFSSLFYAVKTPLTGQSLYFADWKWLGLITLFALITTVLSVLCIVLAIQLIGSTSAAVMGAFEPVIAVAISVTLFGEKLTWNLASGTILILCAVCLSILGNKIRSRRAFRNKLNQGVV